MQNTSENQPSEEDLPSASHPAHLLQELDQELDPEAIEISSEISMKVGSNYTLPQEAGIRRGVNKSSEPVLASVLYTKYNFPHKVPSGDVKRSKDLPLLARNLSLPRILDVTKYPEQSEAVLKQPKQYEAQLIGLKNSFERYQFKLEFFFSNISNAKKHYLKLKQLNKDDQDPNTAKQSPNINFDFEASFFLDYVNGYLEAIARNIESIEINLQKLGLSKFSSLLDRRHIGLDYTNDVIASIENLQQQINVIDNGYTSQDFEERYKKIYDEIQLAINYQIKLTTQIEPRLEESGLEESSRASFSFNEKLAMPQPLFDNTLVIPIEITSHRTNKEDDHQAKEAINLLYQTRNPRKTKNNEIIKTLEKREETTTYPIPEEMEEGEIKRGEIENSRFCVQNLSTLMEVGEKEEGEIKSREMEEVVEVVESESKETKSPNDLFFNLLNNFSQLASQIGEQKNLGVNELIEKKSTRCLLSSLQCYRNKNLLGINKKQTSYFIFENKIYIFEISLTDHAFNPANSNISQAPQPLISKDELKSKITELESFNSQNTLGNLANSKKLKSIDLTELTKIKQDKDIPKSILKQLEKYLEPNTTAIATATLTLREAGRNQVKQFYRPSSQL